MILKGKITYVSPTYNGHSPEDNIQNSLLENAFSDDGAHYKFTFFDEDTFCRINCLEINNVSDTSIDSMHSYNREVSIEFMPNRRIPISLKNLLENNGYKPKCPLVDKTHAKV